MPFFDGMDWSDPQAMASMNALAQAAGAFGKAAMPSSLPVPTGAALGSGAQAFISGGIGGAHDAQDYRAKNLDITGKAIGTDQALIIENMLRKALGKPELTQADLTGNTMPRSPIFGLPQLSPKAPAATAPTKDAPGAPNGPQTSSPSDQTSGADQGSSIGNTLAMKMLGFAPTDYQKAKMAAQMLPPGPDRVEAERAAAKTAGINITGDVRQGAVETLWDPNKKNPDGSTGGYSIAFKNPALPEGYTLGANGEAEAVPGGPEAVSDIEDRKQSAHAKAKMKEEGFGNYLEFGPAAAAGPTGDIKAPLATPAPNGYAARVAQLESGGAANPPPNASSTAAGQDQFVNGTWLDQAKKYLPPQVTAGKSDQQILAMRSDPQISSFLTNKYAADNGATLTKAGVKNIGPTELYLGHHFGPGGASAILKAAPNTPVEQVLPPEVLKANPDLAGATVADIYSSARHAMKGVQPIASGAPQQQSYGAIPASGNTGGVKSSIPNASEAAAVPTAEAYLKPRMEEWAKQEDEWADALPSNITGEQRSLAIAKALKETQSGKWATEKADIAAGLRTVGVKLPDSVLNDPAAVQTALKDNFQSTLAQIRAFTSRPAAVEVQLASKNFANPNLQPEANAKIIAQVVGNMRWERALMNDWAAAKGKPNADGKTWLDPQDFQRAWIQHNPVQKYIDSAEKDIGPLKGMKGALQADPKIKAMITPENIAHTAKTHNISEDQVKAQLRAKGYDIP